MTEKYQKDGTKPLENENVANNDLLECFQKREEEESQQ